jgi:hypothetical protein
MYWTTGSGRIELQMTKNEAANCAHSGQCDNDVMALSKQRKIQKQLDKIPPELLAEELKEYGAWDSEELADHEQNKQRILWLAANDIMEGN